MATNNIWRKLWKLTLSHNNLTDEDANAIVSSSAWPFLEVLDLSGNQIKSEGANALARNMTWMNLKLLDLSKTSLARWKLSPYQKIQAGSS
jgi:Ran GTPase-activating protein (RanGAP) involved in mRNA processing and transport